MPTIPRTLVPVLLRKMQKQAEYHPAVLDVRPAPSGEVVGELVDKLWVLIEHMPFELGRPRRLRKKDPRRSIEKNVETWALPVLFQKKPGAEMAFRPDVLFHLRTEGKKMSRVPAAARVTMEKLARATALRIMGEDMGLKWRDNEGFRHARNGVEIVVGFEVPSSDSEPTGKLQGK